MSELNRITLQRLRKLPQFPSLWEGERRCLGTTDFGLEGGEVEAGLSVDCILWVDGMQGEVRSVAMVPSDCGYEPLVRTLIQAMDSPHGDQAPARPKKILVRNRELQFYLRGVLQDLDITVEYAPELPLIDAFFETLAESSMVDDGELPEGYADALMAKAMEIWEIAPWHVLNEQQILAVEVNGWDLESLYVSVLGMGGIDYGLLMYRSLESLMRFREQVLEHENSPKRLQEAFLEQDCLYVNYELLGESPGPLAYPEMGWGNPPPEAVRPDFGSLHPLEGMRTELVEEEAISLLVALEALRRFLERHYEHLELPPYRPIEGSYRVPNPDPSQSRKTHLVKVKTLPEVTAEIDAKTQEAFFEGFDDGTTPVLQNDLPDNALVKLLKLPPSWLHALHHKPNLCFEAANPETLHADLPVILIQTTRLKGQAFIEQLHQAQGIQAMCLNPGQAPLTGQEFLLGILHTGNGEFHLFSEYDLSDRKTQQELSSWQQMLEASAPDVAIIIASGVTGKCQGNPTPKQLMGCFIARARPPEELGLAPLQLQYALDWELD